jgi:pimeloyl-ACP methyl ester carboxylesterase
MALNRVTRRRVGVIAASAIALLALGVTVGVVRGSEPAESAVWVDLDPPVAMPEAVLTDTSGTAEQRGMRLLTLLFPAAYRSADPAYAESFPIPTERMSTAAIGLQDRAIGEWQGVWNGLKSITAPTLFVTGADDVIAPARNAKLMAAVVPGAELEEVPGAGHGLMYQDPQKLAGVVMDFLDR